MTKIALPLLAALSLGACTSPGPDKVTVLTTVTETAAAAPQSEPEECANPDARIEDTALFTSSQTVPFHGTDLIGVPTDFSGFLFLFSPDNMRNNFDPCLPLSWAVLHGSNGDAERGPAGTGSSIADVVVFFHYDELITDPAPSEIRSIEDVTRLGDTTVQVIHGHAGRSTAEGVTEIYVVDHAWRDGRLVTEGPDAARYETVAAETVNLTP